MIEQKFFMRPKDGYRSFLYYGLEDFIKQNLTKQMVGVEIGSYAGESSTLFANNVKKLYCVDTWSDEHLPQFEEGQNTSAEIESIFRERTSYIVNIHILKMTSEEASKKFEDESIDFVYLDGGHTTLDITSDSSVWYPKLKKGGIFSGHDYNSFTVSQVVNEFCRKHNKSPINVYSDYTWSFVK